MRFTSRLLRWCSASRQILSAASLTALLQLTLPAASCQSPAGRAPTSEALREYAGTYQWSTDAFVYLQPWSEFTGKNQLVAFDESGDVRTLYPADRDHFFAGPGAAISSSVESNITFQRDSSGRIISLTWTRHDAAPRVAQRVDIERRYEVSFTNGSVRLAGTLITPRTDGRHPAIVLVHGSGAEDREYIVPLAHFLVRHGIALLGYDKRGVGASTGDWRKASFDDLAADVVAAVEYLKTRSDVDSTQIGLLGWSQAGWVMPLAAVRTKDIAFLISVSGAAVAPGETAIDEARNEMTASGMKPEIVEEVIRLMQLEYRFAGTGQGWDDYFAARQALAARMGRPPASFPAAPNDSMWSFIRTVYLYDPAPTLRRLRVPTLAIFGALDDNILAEKNRAAWESHLRAAGNTDFSLHVLPNANHLQLEAKTGTNAEMATLTRFVPVYSATIRDWLEQRVRTFTAK